jgi:hypothetical protein
LAALRTPKNKVKGSAEDSGITLEMVYLIKTGTNPSEKEKTESFIDTNLIATLNTQYNNTMCNIQKCSSLLEEGV